jgi:predicted ATPase/DNA-binding SARP family transcriptional activator
VTSPLAVRHSARVDRSELPLRVDVLGPLTLHVGGEAVDVPGPRRRALLAILAVEGDRGVGIERLVDTLWPDGAPDNATAAVHSHVSRLRGHLGAEAGRLERRGRGYRLRLEPFEADVDAARRLARDDPAAALALWRGPALEEFRAVHELEVASVALDELRLHLTDDLLEARLATGDQTVVVDALEAATAAPLRERTTHLLVRALAAAGRTAEAMEVAHGFRRRLVEETGLDPTPELAALEQLVASGAVAPATSSRVPRPDGPMVGRGQEREEVLRLLGAHGVVTLTGPGGVGKTRLALDIAAGWEESEVVVVALGAVARPERVAQAVASRLGLRLTGEVRADDVALALAERRLLLVLDNGEHVVDACRGLVVAVRRVASGVRVLVTSRVTLQASGEYVVRLQPLPVPREAADLDALRRQPGVRAFVEHARRRTPGYDLAAADAADLVEVLRRLDGLPLGIELAARQVGVMPMRAVRERLDRALDLATGRSGPEDARQRTLRVSIASSYELLDEPEQRLLRSLAVFPGGVDLATVEALAGGDGDPLDRLHALVDASLLVADAASGRYRVLFIVRSFLNDALEVLGEAEAARQAFLSRCVEVADEIREGVYGVDEPSQDRRLRAELDNFRAARDLARERGDPDTVERITLPLIQVVTWRDLREIWTWAIELADDPDLAGRPDRVRALGLAAEAARLIGDFASVTRFSDEAFARAEGTRDLTALARAWSARATVAHYRGDFARATQEWLRAAEVAEPREAGAFACSAALAATYGGHLDEARRLLDRADVLLAPIGSPSQHAYRAYVEGEWRAPTDLDAALACYREAIDLARRSGAGFVEGVARVSFVSAQSRSGDVAGAAAGYVELLREWRRTGHNPQLWTTARNAAELLASAGHVETATLVLIAAEDAPGAAAVGPDIARYSQRSFVRPGDLSGPDELLGLRVEAVAMGRAGVLDRAEAVLEQVAGKPVGPRGALP